LPETPTPMAEPPEIVTLHTMSTDRAFWRLAGRGLDINTGCLRKRHFPACYYLLGPEMAVKGFVEAVLKLNRSQTIQQVLRA
jgi:hypothetical protein